MKYNRQNNVLFYASFLCKKEIRIYWFMCIWRTCLKGWKERSNSESKKATERSNKVKERWRRFDFHYTCFCSIYTFFFLHSGILKNCVYSGFSLPGEHFESIGMPHLHLHPLPRPFPKLTIEVPCTQQKQQKLVEWIHRRKNTPNPITQ